MLKHYGTKNITFSNGNDCLSTLNVLSKLGVQIDIENKKNGDIVNSRYPPKEYTAVPGQLLMPYLKKMKQAISDSKDFDPNFDIVAANKWLRDEKRMGNCK